MIFPLHCMRLIYLQPTKTSGYDPLGTNSLVGLLELLQKKGFANKLLVETLKSSVVTNNSIPKQAFLCINIQKNRFLVAKKSIETVDMSIEEMDHGLTFCSSVFMIR